MVKEINPKETSRAGAFDLFMNFAYPMLTGIKTFDITNLMKVAQKTGTSKDLLLNYCIGKAAEPIQEFYLLPVEKKLMQYDSLAVRAVVTNKDNGKNNCDIETGKDLETFREQYTKITEESAQNCTDRELLNERMVIFTQAYEHIEMDGVIPAFSGKYNNPLLLWLKYKKKGFRYYLTVTFRYHHAQMDGEQAGRFFNNIQKEIDSLA